MFYAKQKPKSPKVKLTFTTDLSKELYLSKLQKGDFNKFKFLVNNLLESRVLMKKTQPSTFHEQERLKGFYALDTPSQ